MSKCDKCSHKEVCKHKDAFQEAECGPFPDVDFIKIDVNCSFYNEQEKIMRDRLLQQQCSGVGSNVKMPINPNFYGYGRDEN